VEKFEYYANRCSFALALMTPDDTLAGPDGTSAIWRARPNVILEIGWFMARLGRTRVMLLSQGAPQLSGRLREAGLL
jgi:predicted nucleotide-binding protein